MFGGHEIAESTSVLVVREAGKLPVRYFPRGDVEMTVLERTGHQTTSETKGVASYFTIYRDAHVVENAVWSFEAPPPAFAPIAGHVAFQRGDFEFAAQGHTPADWDMDGEDGPRQSDAD